MTIAVPALLRRRTERRQTAAVAATPWGELWRSLRPYRAQVALAGAVVTGTLAATLAGPMLVSYAIDHGLVRRDLHVVDLAGALYLTVAAAFFLLQRAQTAMLSRIGEKALNDLRKRVFGHLLAQPLAFYDSESSAQLLSRMTADIDVLESLVQSGIGSTLMSIGLFVFSLVVLVALSPLLFAATLVCLVPVLWAAARYRVDSTRAYTAVRRRIADTLASVDEGLAGVRVVQAFGQEERLEAQFEQRNAAQLQAELLTVRLGARFFPRVEGVGVVATAVILLIGGLLVHDHLTTVGTVAAFALYLVNLFNAIQSLSQLFDLLQSSGAAMTTIHEVLKVRSAMPEPARPATLPERGAIELERVSFTYGPSAHDEELVHHEPALTQVALRIEPGEHLVLVGPTGAGKSTLAKLIGRLYDPTEGTVRFGGVDLRQAQLQHLRRRILLMPQEGFLFRGSVLDNILIARPEAGGAEARRVLEQLGIAEYFERLPQGLHSDVGERGSQLSAGERQLVSIARAALADPAVLVMDEATSSLDPGTEQLVERAMAALTSTRTTVTVAHRLTTAERADRVGVIEGGELVELGRHEELVEADGYYSRLAGAWVAGES